MAKKAPKKKINKQAGKVSKTPNKASAKTKSRPIAKKSSVKKKVAKKKKARPNTKKKSPAKSFSKIKSAKDKSVKGLDLGAIEVLETVNLEDPMSVLAASTSSTGNDYCCC